MKYTRLMVVLRGLPFVLQEVMNMVEYNKGTAGSVRDTFSNKLIKLPRVHATRAWEYTSAK